MNTPQTLALDFDGIICNGLREYFLTTWRAYRHIWPTSTAEPDQALAQTFYTLRPVIETGWEMPVLLRAIIMGFEPDQVLLNWPTVRDRIVASEDLSPPNLAQQVDQVRDHWVQSDLAGWLDLHEFYEGVIARLQGFMAQDLPLYVITTKESRFVMALLQRAGVSLPPAHLFGKDCRRPKADTLRLLQQQAPTPIWFIEDRLATLTTIKAQPDLTDVGLFLGNWGYNTPQHRQSAALDPRIRLLSLLQFHQDFEHWVPII